MSYQAEPCGVIEGVHYKSGEWVRLFIQGGRIEAIHSMEERLGTIDKKSACFVAPGLVDLQINGHAGFDLNTEPLSVNTVLELSKALWKEGVTAYFPTLITHDEAVITVALRSIVQACGADEAVDRTIAGIHLEGPFISPEDGARGAHPKEHVRAPSWELFRRWQDAAEGRIRLITVSPEWPEASEFIGRCTEHGVTVSIGHTAATPEQIREAVAAGARMSTHLGNGAHLMLPRHPNYLWEQLALDELWTCVIADGFHLPDAFLKVVHRVKAERMLLVSDAVMLSGMEPGAYRLHIGGSVVLTPEGRLHLANNPSLLAGSAQMLTSGIAHLVRSKLCSLPEAWNMASTGPSRLMRLPGQEGLVVGAPADITIFEPEESEVIRIRETYIQGLRVFRETKTFEGGGYT